MINMGVLEERWINKGCMSTFQLFL